MGNSSVILEQQAPILKIIHQFSASLNEVKKKNVNAAGTTALKKNRQKTRMIFARVARTALKILNPIEILPKKQRNKMYKLISSNISCLILIILGAIFSNHPLNLGFASLIFPLLGLTILFFANKKTDRFKSTLFNLLATISMSFGSFYTASTSFEKANDIDSFKDMALKNGEQVAISYRDTMLNMHINFEKIGFFLSITALIIFILSIFTVNKKATPEVTNSNIKKRRLIRPNEALILFIIALLYVYFLFIRK